MAFFPVAAVETQPFIDIFVLDAGRSLLAPCQTRIPDPGVCVSGTALRTGKEDIIFPELDVSAAALALLHADVFGLEMRRIHSGAALLHWSELRWILPVRSREYFLIHIIASRV
jgi:hypothetical protein